MLLWVLGLVLYCGAVGLERSTESRRCGSAVVTGMHLWVTHVLRIAALHERSVLLQFRGVWLLWKE